jgi:uncharacterized membrane protein
MTNFRKITFGCHGMTERCFSFRGKPMPFCSRCLGCSIGHIISFLLFIFNILPSFFFAVILIIPLGIDWSIQRFFLIMSNNNRRLITGVLGGLGVGIIIWKLVRLLLVLLLEY